MLVNSSLGRQRQEDSSFGCLGSLAYLVSYKPRRDPVTKKNVNGILEDDTLCCPLFSAHLCLCMHTSVHTQAQTHTHTLHLKRQKATRISKCMYRGYIFGSLVEWTPNKCKALGLVSCT